MQLAKKLLKEGKRVKQVAAECGFNDVNYFCKCFKKHEGCTPVQYANR
jgi:two-component system response regulator YesN